MPNPIFLFFLRYAIMAARRYILSVSYDEQLLITRRMLLENAGYKVVSALEFGEAIARCRHGAVDLFILGHSLPYADKQKLIKAFRRNCTAPILSLCRQGERIVASADYHTLSDDPNSLLSSVADILAPKKTAHASKLAHGSDVDKPPQRTGLSFYNRSVNQR